MNILFVDEDRRVMSSYVDELSACGHNVSFHMTVDSALKSFEENSEQISLAILDMMIPAGKAFKNVNTEKGLRTGLRLYETIRKIKGDLPVIIFTNVSDPKLTEVFEREQNCWLLSKKDYLAHELAEKINKIVGQKKQED